MLERPAQHEPAGALVFLHGRGGLAEDVLPFVDDIDPARRLHGYAPQGPIVFADGRAAWGEPEGSDGRNERAAEAVLAWYDSLPFPPERTVLAGWSQGAAVAYALALTGLRPRPAALLAFGGFLPAGPWGSALRNFLPDGEWRPRLEPPLPALAIVHGANDHVVPVANAREARALLEAAGSAVHYRETTSGHWLDPAAMPPLAALVASVLDL